jgi:hypothetical protein
MLHPRITPSASQLEQWSSVYSTEVTRNYYISAEVTQRPRFSSQPKWREYLIRTTAAKQLNRTRLQVAIGECRFSLASLNDDIVGLEDERLLTAYHGNIARRMIFSWGVARLYILPAAPGTRNRFVASRVQTVLTGRQLQSLASQVEIGADFRPDPVAEGVQEQLERLTAALAQHRAMNERRDIAIDRLEHRLQVARSGENTKEKRELRRFEAALADGRRKLGGLDEEMAANLREIDGIKEEAREMRESEPEIRARIEQCRRLERLDPETLRRATYTYATMLGAKRESVRMLELTNQMYERRIVAVRKEMRAPGLEQNVRQGRARIVQMRENNAGKHLTSVQELRILEKKQLELSTTFETCKNREKILIDRIRELVEQAVKFKIPIPWVTKVPALGLTT